MLGVMQPSLKVVPVEIKKNKKQTHISQRDRDDYFTQTDRQTDVAADVGTYTLGRLHFYT